MREAIRVVAEEAIKQKVFPGCVIGVVGVSGERVIIPVGETRYESGDVVTEDTIYDLASITKSLPTASLALTMMEGGSLSLDKPVTEYIPELHNDFSATVRDLLTYRVSGPRLSELASLPPERIQQTILKKGFSGPPGAGGYTNLPAFLLGLIVERVGGDTLENLARDVFFEPLKMQSTTYFPSTDASVAPTEIDDIRGEVCGLPHDESAYAFAMVHRTVGHAGLFSTAPDILNFVERILRDPSFTAMRSGGELGLGWQIDEQFFMGNRAGPRAFGKTGFTGTSMLIDTQKGKGFVVLSNRTYPKRPVDAVPRSSKINVFRARIADIILSSAS